MLGQYRLCPFSIPFDRLVVSFAVIVPIPDQEHAGRSLADVAAAIASLSHVIHLQQIV